MCSITSEEDALVESVVGGDTLSNLIDGEPVYVSKLKLIRLKDLLCGVNADILSLLASVCTSLQLDVEAAEASLSRDDHDRSSILRVNQALVLDIREGSLDSCIHHTPDDVRRLTLHGDLSFPLAITLSSAGDALPYATSGSIAAKQVLASNGPLLLGLRILKHDFNRMGLGELIMRFREGLAGDEASIAEETAFGRGDNLFWFQVLTALQKEGD